MMESGAQLPDGTVLEADVIVVGSGAGGSVVAAGLARAGRRVIVLEEGGLYRREDFSRPDEGWSYPNLYQDRGARSTADLGITILQGRAVGGGTLINWTTCYRTPDRILAHWRAEHGIELDPAALVPHFDAVEARLGIEGWNPDLINRNNGVLQAGCEALGWEHHVLARNVRGCANTGLCGLGCPMDAKQAMHLTYLQDAVADGARVLADVRGTRIVREGSRAVGVEAVGMVRGSSASTGRTLRVNAPVVIASGGAINTPALLLRSGIDGGGRVGKRTFLHPVVATVGRHARRIEPFHGAPQSVSSHHFIEGRDGGMGFFLEVAPMQPMLTASAGWFMGTALQDMMTDLPHASSVLALVVDGLRADEAGGTVSLRNDGRIRVDYPMHDALVDAFREATVASARVQLAGGANEVVSTHVQPVRVRSASELSTLARAPYGTHRHGVFTAHQMGGCAMGADPSRHVVDAGHRVRGVDGLYVVDGSVLPTSLGVNPSETIYGLAHRAVGSIVADTR